jgi:hypothetical protein
MRNASIFTCSAPVLTMTIIYFTMWHPALMKSESLARESMTHVDDWGVFSNRGGAESSPVGTPPAAPSPHD